MDPAPWTGRVFLLPGRMLFLGTGGGAELHAHHALQIVVGFEAPFRLRVGGAAVTRRIAVIPSGAPHAFSAGAGLTALLLIEPESAMGRAVEHGCTRASLGPRALEQRVCGLPPPAPSPRGEAEAAAWIDGLADRLAGQSCRCPRRHPAVQRAVDLLTNALDETPRLDAVARKARLSPGRLVHLFSAQVGMPMRRFVLWQRVRRAAELAAHGASMTEAAHAAGFADSAHLSRTFRRMFGLSPSTLMPLARR